MSESKTNTPVPVSNASPTPDDSLFDWLSLTCTQFQASPESELASLLSRLEGWANMAQGAYSPNTLRAWKADWAAFIVFTLCTQQPFLPSTPETVRAFLFHRAEGGLSMAALRRLRSSIARLHLAANLADPTQSEPVRLALRECARTIGTRQEQARGLVWREIDSYLRRPPTNLRDWRDRALVCVAYDGSLRPEELVDVDLQHITFDGDAAATLLIPTSKTDPEGEGALLAIAPSTVALLKEWIRNARIDSGPVFCRVIGRSTVGERLTAQSVSDVFQRIGRQIGLSASEVRELSGHSARVGSTQDLFGANMDLPAIMQQGRWKDARMPVRYGERLLAKRGVMMQLAARQGRA